jgi:hypothetical protein
VPGDPTDVGRAPINVILFHVENVMMRRRNAHEVSGRGVDDAFGLAGRAAGIEDVKHILRIHGLGIALVGGTFHELIP